MSDRFTDLSVFNSYRICASFFFEKKKYTFYTFYQMKEDRRPNASLGERKGWALPIKPGRFARAHFLPLGIGLIFHKEPLA